MTVPKHYTIRTVTDFLEVPEDRRGVALAEFRQWLRLREGLADIMGDLMKLSDAFEWVDDDLGEARLVVKVDGV